MTDRTSQRKRVALVSGITGQDGAYLAEYLGKRHTHRLVIAPDSGLALACQLMLGSLTALDLQIVQLIAVFFEDILHFDIFELGKRFTL